MVDRKADGFQRVEVITGIGRRRDWPDDFKAQVVAESLEEGVVISDIARRHGLPPQRLFAWRNQMHTARKATGKAPTFAPVVMAAPSPSKQCETPPAPDVIEILIGTTLIRVRGAVEADSLRAILRAVRAVEADDSGRTL